jgi:hypothetical protein
MDSVSVAFELMQIELEAAVENLNSDGTNYFHKAEYEMAQNLADKGTALQQFRARVEALAHEWQSVFSEHTEEMDLNTTAEDSARRILSTTKASRTGLFVKFPSGIVFSENTAAETLVKAIEQIGFERVARLNIRVNGENIVSREASTKYNETKVDSFFIKTHSSTSQKQRHLLQISDELSLKLTVKIV